MGHTNADAQDGRGQGLIARWGFGGFALIVTTVLAQAMPSAALGWLQGALYGLGTTFVLVGTGAFIGTLVRHRRLERTMRGRWRKRAPAGRSWPAADCSAAGAAGLLYRR